MLRVVELVGLCAPLVGAALVLYYRRRMGGAFGFALAGAAVAGGGSVVGVVTGRAMWFGGGGAEGITERMEFGGGVRNLLLAGAWVLLLVAITRRPRRVEVR
ncbi:hypothetical protein [Nocardia wallacei]|uniref:hypothetical protein n=1 Tax=Nocardia TaxID=1817 RepID=UPI0024565692|nr:hypothetical protein [Nocardia wallacei]